MQYAGVRPFETYTLEQQREGHSGATPGLHATDSRGHEYVYLRFESDVGVGEYVAWNHASLAATPSADLGHSRPFGFVQAAVEASAAAPVFAWAGVYGEHNATLGIAIGRSTALRNNAGAWSSSAGDFVRGVNLLSDSTTTNTVRVRLRHPTIY